jgi:putative phosphoribosyl transferase
VSASHAERRLEADRIDVGSPKNVLRVACAVKHGTGIDVAVKRAVATQTQSASAVRATRPVIIPVGSTATLAGELAVPDHAQGLVIFAHGSCTARSGAGAQSLADTLHRHGLATLLIDLLTEKEEDIDERTGKLRFDMVLLSNRIVSIGSWAQRDAQVSGLPVGLFGTHTAVGAALLAVTQQPRGFKTVVSYSGRPDLAGSALGRVMIPTLFMVGSADEQATDLSRITIERMHNDARLEVIANASGAFEEAPALDQVARMAAEWFSQRLRN